MSIEESVLIDRKDIESAIQLGMVKSAIHIKQPYFGEKGIFRINPQLSPFGVVMMFHLSVISLKETIKKEGAYPPLLVGFASLSVKDELSKLPGVKEQFDVIDKQSEDHQKERQKK